MVGEHCIFCENNKVKCYAEDAFNEVSKICKIYPVDTKYLLCCEIDNLEDLAKVSDKISEIENRTVYMCFSTDILHSGHIAIKKSSKTWKIDSGSII